MVVFPTALCRALSRLCFTNLPHSCLPPVIVIRWSFRHFRTNSLFIIFISRVALNNCKVSTIFFRTKRQRSISNFDFIGQSSKILMYIILPDRILIFYKIVGMQRGGREFGAMPFFKLVEFTCKNINQHRMYRIFVSK